MHFYQLALFLEKLENTTLRNKMVEILSELFKKTNQDEIQKICYLLQGRVTPLYDSLEFQIADKLIIEAISQALGIEPNKVVSEFKSKGDLGTAAEALKKGQTTNSKLTIIEVYDKLYDIAKTTGIGSVDKKTKLLADLIKNLDSLSVRYIVRIPLNKMRLGFSDMSILDALSYTISGTKEYRGEIEKAYNVRPDLGYIASKIKKQGISGIKHVEPTIGVPILMAKADRLTSPAEILDKIGTCSVEFKYDGLRLQVHYQKNKRPASRQGGSKEQDIIKLYSRNLEDVTHMFPDIVEGVKKQVATDEVIFEGEVVAYNPKNGVFIPFQQTMQRKRKYDIAQKALEIPVKLFAFELLYNLGKNYISLPYKTRKEKLKQVIKEGNVIIYAQETIVSKEIQIDELFSESVKKGFEGIIAKKLDGVYQAGMRGFNWIKFKRAMSATLTDTFDVLVMGYTKGEGKRTTFGVGQFLSGVYDSKSDKFVTVSKIGTGLTDEQFKEFYKRVKPLERKDRPKEYDVDKLLEADKWLTPSLVVEVAADEITRSQVHTAGRLLGPSKNKKALAVVSPGYALRFPRLIRFRDDKKPKDATTLIEIESMFKKQNHKE